MIIAGLIRCLPHIFFPLLLLVFTLNAFVYLFVCLFICTSLFFFLFTQFYYLAKQMRSDLCIAWSLVISYLCMHLCAFHCILSPLLVCLMHISQRFECVSLQQSHAHIIFKKQFHFLWHFFRFFSFLKLPGCDHSNRMQFNWICKPFESCQMEQNAMTTLIRISHTIESQVIAMKCNRCKRIMARA